MVTGVAHRLLLLTARKPGVRHPGRTVAAVRAGRLLCSLVAVPGRLRLPRARRAARRDAKALLDSEHARRAIGEVAVPYGTCSEPSNVQAGGNACPYRFRCVGRGHFRTDVSYLPA